MPAWRKHSSSIALDTATWLSQKLCNSLKLEKNKKTRKQGKLFRRSMTEKHEFIRVNPRPKTQNRPSNINRELCKLKN